MQMKVCTRNLTKEFITKVNSLFKPKKRVADEKSPTDSGRRLADETPPIGSPGCVCMRFNLKIVVQMSQWSQMIELDNLSKSGVTRFSNASPFGLYRIL